MSDEEELRVQVKRPSKKKCGFEVEQREDGFYYVAAVPSKKCSIQPGDRVMEINGIKYTDFKSEKRANELFDLLVLDVVPQDEDSEEDDEEQSSEDDYEVVDVSE